MAHYLEPLLNPKSIAVVGATPRNAAPGNQVIANLLKGQYQGSLYAVNPNRDEVLGIKCYDSLAALPETVEHVIFTVADQHIEACMDQAIALGVKACSIYSLLLQQEDDSSPILKESIRTKAEQSGMLLAGGNSLGFYNFAKQVWGCGYNSRDHQYSGNVALLSQSSAGMQVIINSDERINFNFAVATGQELIVSVEDYLDYVLELPETKVVGLFLETSRHPQQLIAAFAKAKQKQIPIVAVKVGKTKMAAELAVSHSGALVGSDKTYQAVFDSYGVQRVDDLDQLATALIMFSQPQPVLSGGVVSIHDSGGERRLFIDLADQLDVPLAELDQSSVERLQSMLGRDFPAVNPLEARGGGVGSARQNMSDCLAVLLADPNAALGAAVHDRAAQGKFFPDSINYLQAAQQASGKPLFFVTNGPCSVEHEDALALSREGFPVINGVTQFLVGARCLLNYRDFLAAEDSGSVELPTETLDKWRRQLSSKSRKGETRLSEIEASNMLSDFSVSMTESVLVSSEARLISLASSLTYPVVLKTAATDIGHKSDVGGVVLGLDNDVALFDAYRDMSRRLGPRAIVVPMVKEEGVEMLLGIAHDNQFGPVIVMGAGGIYTEVLNDVVTLLPPFDAAAARRRIEKLKIRPILDGARGQPALDIDAYCEAAACLSALSLELKEQIKEVDINPVQVMPSGCVGLDALVLLTATAEPS